MADNICMEYYTSLIRFSASSSNLRVYSVFRAANSAKDEMCCSSSGSTNGRSPPPWSLSSSSIRCYSDSDIWFLFAVRKSTISSFEIPSTYRCRIVIYFVEIVFDHFAMSGDIFVIAGNFARVAFLSSIASISPIMMLVMSAKLPTAL